MDRESLRARGRRKLSKSQIIDILERNVAIYKDEDNFVHYLVDLATYLMEYEYDWADSGGPPGRITDSDSVSEPPTPPEVKSSAKISSRMTFDAIAFSRRLCPFCGSMVGDAVICPICRNITK